jgi:hypothetical protein
LARSKENRSILPGVLEATVVFLRAPAIQDTAERGRWLCKAFLGNAEF